MNDGAVLSGLRVIELANDVAGWSAGLHLSEAGADVLRIERLIERPTRVSSAQFSVLKRGKRSVALDVETEAGQASLRDLLASADVLIHDLPPDTAGKLGLGDESLAAAFPALIVSAIGAWPRSHAWADEPVRETLVLAALGVLGEQPGHRPGPIYIRMPFANWIAGWLSAIAVMARLITRKRDGGRGGKAHTSLAQAALVPMTMHWSRAARPTPVFAKGLDKSTPIPLHRCADGRWIHVHYSPDKAPWMAQALTVMGPDAIAEANSKYPPSHVAPNFGANRLIIASRSAEDWAQHFWQHDVAAQIAVPFGEIYQDQQARLNGYVVERDGHLQPGLAYHLSSSSDAVEPQAAKPVAAGLAPLSGLKVLDLGAYLAGPFACMLLADLGADVIKVEPPAGDAMRRLERIFAGTQRGKRGLALKLGEPASAPALESLVKWADVVHHNIRLPAARKLGIAPEQLAALNPGVISGHISSYGPRGARADWPGFDQLMQAACGWEVENGGEGQPPQWLRFGVGDHLAALSCVFAVLLGLYQREKTGQGQPVASSLLGAMLMTASEVVASPDGSLTPMAHLDAQQCGLSRGDRLYACKDGWLMVAAWTAAELAAFDALAGSAAEAFFAAKTVDQAFDLLRTAGIPSEPARENQRDPFLDEPRHAVLRTRYEHAVYGELQQIGALWDFGDLPLNLGRPPPALGEHSREVLRERGLADAEIDRLADQGITLR